MPKHQFIYFCDYGYSHEFIVTALGIETRADDGDYGHTRPSENARLTRSQ